jgi:hypothetical protein
MGDMVIAPTAFPVVHNTELTGINAGQTGEAKVVTVAPVYMTRVATAIPAFPPTYPDSVPRRPMIDTNSVLYINSTTILQSFYFSIFC